MRKCYFVLAVVLCLFIGPMIFMPYYASSITPTQPKITKEFATSAYLDESDDSINLFRETLKDDVFFTPDGFYDETPVTAFDGNDDWADIIHKDGINWSIFTDAEYCRFQGLYSIEGFEYSIFGYGAGGGGNISVYDTMAQDFHILEEITNVAAQWYNGTYWGTNYEPDDVYFWSENNVGAISMDYIELRFHYLPLLDYSYATNFTHWGESFTNVSDWVSYGLEGNDTFSTDDDILTFVCEYNATSLYDSIYSNAISITDDLDNYYFEFNFFHNETGSTWIYSMFISLWSGDDVTGDEASYALYRWNTDWTTNKIHFSEFDNYDALSTIESIRIQLRAQPSKSFEFYSDYMRFGKSTEMGWQHDGSTTLGVTNDGDGDKTYTSSSDGDILTMSVDHAGAAGSSYFFLYTDMTTTRTHIERDYYQFIEARYRLTIYGNLEVYSLNYETDGRKSTIAGLAEGIENNTWVTVRLNHKTGSGVGGSNRGYYVYATSTTGGSYTLETDYVKAYSIANFTVTQDATTPIDHYLYVDPAGVLYRVGSSASQYNITLAYDPAVSIAQATYNQWNMDTMGSASGRIDYALQLYNGSTTTYYNETTGSVPTGTITTLTLITYNAYSFSSIVFVDMHRWHAVDEQTLTFIVATWYLIGSAILIFWSDISTVALDMLLILGGLILIPCSTLYLVKGGKDGMSMDKFFYFCIAFILGWAFFLGGIM